MDKQKLEDYYFERNSTIFSEMLGEDENYRRLKKAKIAAEKSKNSGRKSPAGCHQQRSMEAISLLR